MQMRYENITKYVQNLIWNISSMTHLHFVTIALCFICILSPLHFVTFAFCQVCILSVFDVCYICILSILHFVMDSLLARFLLRIKQTELIEHSISLDQFLKCFSLSLKPVKSKALVAETSKMKGERTQKNCAETYNMNDPIQLLPYGLIIKVWSFVITPYLLLGQS